MAWIVITCIVVLTVLEVWDWVDKRRAKRLRY
jgi:hypothetical protein